MTIDLGINSESSGGFAHSEVNSVYSILLLMSAIQPKRCIGCATLILIHQWCVTKLGHNATELVYWFPQKGLLGVQGMAYACKCKVTRSGDLAAQVVVATVNTAPEFHPRRYAGETALFIGFDEQHTGINYCLDKWSLICRLVVRSSESDRYGHGQWRAVSVCYQTKTEILCGIHYS